MPYNINNSNILQYYPLNTNFYDYSSGSPVNNSTVGGSFALTTATSIDGSGSAYSPGWGVGGTNKSYLTMTSQSPTFSNGLTVSIWIKYRNLPTGQVYSRFFNWIDQRAGATSNWNISINVNGSTVNMTMYGNGSIGQQTFSTGYVINDTNWHHYCFTYASTGSVNVYVDNVNKLTFTHLHTGQPLYVCELARNYYGESGLDGYFDQYVAFNRTLTTTEVSYLYLYPSTLTISSSPSGFISPYTVGTAPTITSITNGYFSFNVNFTAGTGANPAPTTYYYSLNGGSTYTNANTSTSPILISGVNIATTYNITIIANNLAGNTAASNIVVVFIPYPCFKQGTKILRMNQETDDEEYVPVETLRRGDIIRTVNHGYKAIELIGSREIESPLAIEKESSRLYWFRKSKISGLREDLCVTGDHCILHKSITDAKKDQVLGYMGDIYITEGHYRVPAFLDDRSEPYEDSAPATIWHFALENPNIYHNYGVMANGLLVESSSLHYMYKYSNMRLIE